MEPWKSPHQERRPDRARHCDEKACSGHGCHDRCAPGDLPQRARCPGRTGECPRAFTGAAAQGRSRGRLHRDLSPGAGRVPRQADCPAGRLRRAGGDRDGECASADRATGGAGAADRDGRGTAGDQWLARQSDAGVRLDAGKGDAAVRGCVWGAAKLRWQAYSCTGKLRRSLGVRRISRAKRGRGVDGRHRADAGLADPAASPDVGCQGGRGVQERKSGRPRHRRSGRRAHDPPCATRQRPDFGRPIHVLSPGSPQLLRQADCPAGELRGAGGDRDGERAADRRAARGTGAADRDGRGAAGDQRVAWRSRTGLFSRLGEGDTPLRVGVWNLQLLRRRMVPCGRDAGRRSWSGGVSSGTHPVGARIGPAQDRPG